MYRSILLLIALCSAEAQPSGIITTVAGATGVDALPARGFSGDGGPATRALLALANVPNQCDPGRFEQGAHIAVDAAGVLYIADGENQRIRRVGSDGTIATIAGNGDKPSTNERCEPAGPVGETGPALSAKLFNPSDIAVLPNGDMIIADQQNNRIRRVSSAGAISTIAGSGMHNIYAPNIPAVNSPMDWPSAVAVDANGNLYFAEVHSHRVARIGGDGRIVTVAGTGFPGFTGDGIQATAARLRNPTGIAVDRAGNLFIADQGNHRIRRVGTDGIITTVAGTGQAGDSADATIATQALLNTPMDVKVDAAGRLYIADTLNHKVKRVDTAGTISTIAGDGVPGRGADHVAATASSLRSPAGLAIAPNGDLYIADWQNYLVRKVSFSNGPAIAQGGVVNAAAFTGDSFAPGSIVTIVGSQFAVSAEVASMSPLPRNLKDVEVHINEAPVPLFYVSPGQINAQLPFDLSPGPARLRVRTSIGVTPDETLRIISAAPGLFELALNQDSSLNSSENPERTGNVVVIFLTGMGRVTPPVPIGDRAPESVLSRADADISATVDGIASEVLFAGMTPGSIGLAQVNLVIPPGTRPGSRVPVTVRADGQISNTITVAIR